MQWLKDRLSERSTWAGIISLVSVLGINIAPEAQEAIITAAMSVVGVMWVLLGDKKPEA